MPTAATGWLLLISAALLAAGWHHRQWCLFAADELARWAPSERHQFLPVCVRGELLETPRRMRWSSATQQDPAYGTERTRFRFRAEWIRNGRAWRTASGVATVTVEGRLSGLRPGDRLQIGALLRRVPGPANPGERDWRFYLRGQRQLCVLRAPHPECVVRRGRARTGVRVWLRRLRGHCGQLLTQHLDAPSDGLAKAILLGTRGSLSREQTEPFFRTGTIHLLAISGLHVGILACVLLAAVRGQWLPRGVALAAVAILVGGYAALTEGRAPVVRAMVLIHVVCLAWWTRRKPSAFNSLGAAAIVVLIHNPVQLFQPGPQLSFIAVATLAGLGPHLAMSPPLDPLQRLVWRTRPLPVRWIRWMRLRLWQMTLASLGVWLATAPLVQREFLIVTPIGVLLSIMLWIPVAGVLFSGWGVLICHSLSLPGAHWCGRLCELNVQLLQAMRRPSRAVSRGVLLVRPPPRDMHPSVLLWMVSSARCPIASQGLSRLGRARRQLVARRDACRAVGFRSGTGASCTPHFFPWATERAFCWSFPAAAIGCTTADDADRLRPVWRSCRAPCDGAEFTNWMASFSLMPMPIITTCCPDCSIGFRSVGCACPPACWSRPPQCLPNSGSNSLHIRLPYRLSLPRRKFGDR